MLLWLIDDTADHHRVAAATAALVAGVVFAGFASGRAALTAYARLARPGQPSPRPLPDVVLMDFYLGDERGDAVTKRLRALEPASHRPVIIGYSSVRSGSAAIVAAGADLMLPKRSNAAGINPDLLNYLRRWT